MRAEGGRWRGREEVHPWRRCGVAEGVRCGGYRIDLGGRVLEIHAILFV